MANVIPDETIDIAQEADGTISIRRKPLIMSLVKPFNNVITTSGISGNVLDPAATTNRYLMSGSLNTKYNTDNLYSFNNGLITVPKSGLYSIRSRLSFYFNNDSVTYMIFLGVNNTFNNSDTVPVTSVSSYVTNVYRADRTDDVINLNEGDEVGLYFSVNQTTNIYLRHCGMIFEYIGEK
jgi:hypothetical protein